MTANNIQENIKAFAKANKVSATKLGGFINELLELHRPKVGKKASEGTILVREKFASEFQSFGTDFTAKDVASRYSIGPAEANNLLHYYAKQGKIEVSGKVIEAGKRGKRANTWRTI